MGIDVDAVIHESQNSLSEPSVQFVTVSSVVGEEAIPTYSVATSQAFRRELEMAETRFTLRERLSLGDRFIGNDRYVRSKHC